MAADLRSLVSSLQFAELRTSGVSFGGSAAGAPGSEPPALRIESVEVRDLDLQAAPGALRAASVALSNVVVRTSTPASAQIDPSARVVAVAVGELRLKDASLAARALPQRAVADAAGPRWRLEPLGALEGTLRVAIVDAAWIFDADVTMPIAAGEVDFNRVTVEHVGPDSSMGVSRTGVYVDAPNGRTHVALLSQGADVPGVRYEQRSGGLLPGWRGDRGAIDVQPLLEALLAGSPAIVLAPETSDMLARTRLRGEFRLGDGVFGSDRQRLVLAGREQGRNRVALSSSASGRGIVVRMGELTADGLRWESAGAVVTAGALSATLSVQVDAAADGAPAVAASIVELVLRDVAVNAA